MNIADASQQTIYRLAHIGIEVNGVDNVNLWMLLGNLHQRLTNSLKAVTETFPTMAGDEDQLAAWIKKRAGCCGCVVERLVLIETCNNAK
ncbi:hypothetical protein D3C78_1798990 [compost metagenome]